MENKIKNFVTPGEYEQLQNTFNCKTEYNAGEIIMHSDTSIKHNEIVVNIAAYLKLFFKGSKCKVRVEQIEVIFEENYKYKPDVFVICDDATNRGESYTSPPKLIFEVISKSTANHDYITKLAVYQKYKVLEYNIVEQNANIVQYGLIDGMYQIVNTFHKGDIYTSYIFKDLKIDIEDIF